MLGTVLYFAWLLLVPITGVSMLMLRVKRNTLVTVGISLLLLSTPAYCLFGLYVIGLAWPPDIFTHQTRTLALFNVQGYRIAAIEQPGLIEHETYFVVTRPDGKQARLMMDADASTCWHPTIKQHGATVYLLCATQEPIWEGTSYVDLDHMSLYAGSNRYTPSF